MVSFALLPVNTGGAARAVGKRRRARARAERGSEGMHGGSAWQQGLVSDLISMCILLYRRPLLYILSELTFGRARRPRRA